MTRLKRWCPRLCGKGKWRILSVGEVHDQSAPLGRRPPEERTIAKDISKPIGAHEVAPVSLGELLRQHVRLAIEAAVHEELRVVLGGTPYGRSEIRRGYRNGAKARTLTGPTGPVALTLPRGLSRVISDECRRSMKQS